MIQFQHTEYLLFLVAIPVLLSVFAGVKAWKKKTAKKIGDPALVQQLVKDYSPTKFALKFTLFTLAFAIGVIALANPRSPKGSATVNRSGIDVMIALDVSKSMLAQDIQPSRLDQAKQVLNRFIDKLPDDRIGIVVFAGRAYLQMPLTTDHGAAKLFLSSATPDVVPTQGTVIGDALKMSYSAFNTKEKKYKSIILISDGEDHDESALKYAKALADEGVMVNTIGLGSPEGTMIPDPENNSFKKDAAGNPVVTKLNEEELKLIAGGTGGVYQRFSSTDAVVSKIDEQLKTMGQRHITESSLINYKNYFPWLLGIAIILLVIEFFVTEKGKPAKEKLLPVKNVLAALLILVLPLFSIAQKGNDLVKKGNEAYTGKQYQIAATQYQQALTANPSNQAAQYNLGNALYKSDKKEEALTAYDAAIKASANNADKASAYYNKGVVLQNDKKLPECIDAYKNALRLNPADEDARQNLQKALQQQKQQEQQKKQDDQQKKKPQDDQKKDQQQKQKEDENKDQQPKPQPSKMTKKEAEEKLKALLQQEKQLQDKLRKVGAASPSKPDKDW